VISRTGGSSPLLTLQHATHRTLRALTACLAELDLTGSEVNTLAGLSAHQLAGYHAVITASEGVF
jgi:hypothetical protein